MATLTKTATVTGASSNATTLTYIAVNTFSAGQKVSVTGMSPSGYNVTDATIATANGTGFTITNNANPGAFAQGGTATVSIGVGVPTILGTSYLFSRPLESLLTDSDAVERISSQLSGIIINQNLPYKIDNETINYEDIDNYLYNKYQPFKTVLQEFKLPANFKRRSSNILEKIPKLTGFQINLNAIADDFKIVYTLQVRNSDRGWVSLLKDEAIGSKQGLQWFTVLFKPFKLESKYLNSKFRLIIQNASGVKTFYLSSSNPFEETSISSIEDNYFCYVESNTSTSYLSGKTVAKDVPTAVKDDGCLRFRLLGDVADSGLDFFKNTYRSLVESELHDSKNVLDLNQDTYWMSKANPSKYAVENLYFDLSEATTVSAIYLNPITPNVKFNVYYSIEEPQFISDPANDLDMLLWKRVPKEFTATKAQNYIFPNPVYARYIKVEFTHLQASSYISRDFERPFLYKKHPQWVFDYFLSWYQFNTNVDYNPFAADMVDVNFEILNLAYNYYKGDILQGPNGVNLTLNQGDSTEALSQKLTTFLTTTADSIKNIDVGTYFKINTDIEPFFNLPSDRALENTAVARRANMSVDMTEKNNYTLEDRPIITGNTEIVSVKDRNHLIKEKTLPQMYFFLECRHQYREAVAKLTDGKAYFVGIKEIAFQKYDHSIKSDDSIYMSIAGDTINFTENNFKFREQGWSAK